MCIRDRTSIREKLNTTLSEPKKRTVTNSAVSYTHLKENTKFTLLAEENNLNNITTLYLSLIHIYNCRTYNVQNFYLIMPD